MGQDDVVSENVGSGKAAVIKIVALSDVVKPSQHVQLQTQGEDIEAGNPPPLPQPSIETGNRPFPQSNIDTDDSPCSQSEFSKSPTLKNVDIFDYEQCECPEGIEEDGSHSRLTKQYKHLFQNIETNDRQKCGISEMNTARVSKDSTTYFFRSAEKKNPKDSGTNDAKETKTPMDSVPELVCDIPTLTLLSSREENGGQHVVENSREAWGEAEKIEGVGFGAKEGVNERVPRFIPVGFGFGSGVAENRHHDGESQVCCVTVILKSLNRKEYFTN